MLYTACCGDGLHAELEFAGTSERVWREQVARKLRYTMCGVQRQRIEKKAPERVRREQALCNVHYTRVDDVQAELSFTEKEGE